MIFSEDALARSGGRTRRKPQPGWWPGEDLQQSPPACTSQPGGNAPAHAAYGVARLACHVRRGIRTSEKIIDRL
jgi:hypothetical protein